MQLQYKVHCTKTGCEALRFLSSSHSSDSTLLWCSFIHNAASIDALTSLRKSFCLSLNVYPYGQVSITTHIVLHNNFHPLLTFKFLDYFSTFSNILRALSATHYLDIIFHSLECSQQFGIASYDINSQYVSIISAASVMWVLFSS